ncbi:VOC family protein [Diaphorobacter sp. C33]|uniref:Catechol 2,3-dioxygenase-like lactoylglutathione lyase family enzyme n=1 Tax=Diaphorobacter nitroreducens TaxID=164759 RepID=A0AAX1WWN9_9BURK|nr:VOC family protein [Diaphorobacter sp. C33]ROR49000.1 catechol 2,3-dioxygenase-like lactoylglutathione lyase family enzyme [Diaphorobacter nitroreducens]WKK89032.1 VOC family protein [Diaphorobacter sp. C33]
MIDRLDHLVLTTAHEAQCVHFYCTVLGMALQTFGEGRKAFVFNGQKINLHIQGREFEPKALHPLPGALDLCFIASIPLAQVQQRLAEHGIAIECGPVPRTGARGPILSVYVRDPDHNLIEISEYA